MSRAGNALVATSGVMLEKIYAAVVCALLM